jgi:hypothetical protein
MHDTIRYDLFKVDLAGNPCWLESVEGFEAAVTEMEKFAANEPCEYFVFCAQTGTVVGRLHLEASVMSADYAPYRKAS